MVVLEHECASESLEGLVAHKILGPTLQVSDSVSLCAVQDFAHLTRSQVMVMMPVLGPHSENHRHNPSLLVPPIKGPSSFSKQLL